VTPSSFQEFVQGLSVLARGSVHDKLLWAFSLYDTNGDGVITREEMLDIVSAVYELMGKYANPCVDETTAADHVEKVFKVLFRSEIISTLSEVVTTTTKKTDTSTQINIKVYLIQVKRQKVGLH